MAQTPVYDLSKQNIDDDDEESEVVLDDSNQICQDDDDPNDLFGSYKPARKQDATQDNKRYVVPQEALTNYINRQKKGEEKKEEVKILSRDQRPRAKPAPIHKREDKKLLTIKEITQNYKPRVSEFAKRAEEEKKKAEEEKKEQKREENDEDESNMKDLKSCVKKFTNLNNKFNQFKKSYEDDNNQVLQQLVLLTDDMKTVNEDIKKLMEKYDKIDSLEIPPPPPPSKHSDDDEIPPNITLPFLIKDKIQHLQHCLLMVENDTMKQKVCDRQLPIIYDLLERALGQEQWDNFNNEKIKKEREFHKIVNILNEKIDEIYQISPTFIPIPKLRF